MKQQNMFLTFNNYGHFYRADEDLKINLNYFPETRELICREGESIIRKPNINILNKQV